MPGKVREELLCPLFAGNSCYAPLVLVLYLVSVGADERHPLLHCLGELLLIDALKAVRILGLQVDAAGNGVYVVLPAGCLVVLQGTQSLKAHVSGVDLGKRLISPVYFYGLGAQLVAFFHQHLNEFRLVELGLDEYLLTLLDVYALGCDKMRVLS